MSKKITLILLVALTLSCSKKPIQVTSADKVTNLNTKGLIYALPRTVLKIKVEAVKNVIIPGPFGKFAQKYLGIVDVPLKKTEEWKITNIDIASVVESDPTSLYAAIPSDDSKVDFLKLCSSGLILPISRLGVSSTSIKTLMGNNQINDINYTDLSTQPFIAPEKTTFYSKIQHDSIFVRVPVQKDMIVEKNIEEKARDAADFIFSLRKRRSDFLSVDADHNLNGEGLKIAFNEIDRLEQEYLSLFIGKSYSESEASYYEYIPNQPDGETSIIFRFSNSKGILPSSDLSGNPFLLKSEPESIPESYEPLFKSIGFEKNKPIKDVVYYRIPITANIKISDGKNDIFTRRISICQYGPIVTMPIKFMIRDFGLIEF
ncbi:MAG: DUF4831 family protein [Bacteroidales bacterium]|nr:DUF4831 family protein [Bacteroidales bacterium]